MKWIEVRRMITKPIFGGFRKYTPGRFYSDGPFVIALHATAGKPENKITKENIFCDR